MSGSNLKCHFNFPDNLWPMEVDNRQIGQAIHNLVMNAREAMPEGGLLKISAENVKSDDNLSHPKKRKLCKNIHYGDHGKGITKKNLNKIFNPYFSTKKMGN